MLFHGPVIYIDDVYALINSATSTYESMLLPLFTKAKKYQHMREYRFAVWAEKEPGQERELLTASAALIGAMGLESPMSKPQIMPIAEPLEPLMEDEDYDFNDEPDQLLPSPMENVEGGSGDLLDFRRRLFEQANDPATILRPNEIDPVAELPEDFFDLDSHIPCRYSAKKQD